MKTILLAHARLYPKMEPRDAVKLIYQSEFGGGHMIPSYDHALDRILNEGSEYNLYHSIPDEDIGFGFVRTYLYGKAEDELRKICDAFVFSANTHTGDIDRFIKKLDILLEISKTGLLPFSYEVLKAYIDDYASKEYPMVSHSDIYRAEYKPAYRIMKRNI